MIEQVMQFVQNHWMLASAAGVVLMLLIYEETKGRVSGVARLTPQDVVMLLNREDIAVVDLRSRKAFDNGHILGAKNIEHATLEGNMNKLATYKNKKLVLVSDDNAKAISAMGDLQKKGFTSVHILSGGMASWTDAQLPLAK